MLVCLLKMIEKRLIEKQVGKRFNYIVFSWDNTRSSSNKAMARQSIQEQQSHGKAKALDWAEANESLKQLLQQGPARCGSWAGAAGLAQRIRHLGKASAAELGHWAGAARLRQCNCTSSSQLRQSHRSSSCNKARAR